FARGYDLEGLAAQLGIPVRQAHEALSDAETLIALCEAAGSLVASWPAPRRDLIGALGARSAAWRLAYALGDVELSPVRLDEDDVVRVLRDELRGQPALRRDPNLPAPPLRIPGEWRDGEGRVRPHLLAEPGS